MGGAVGGGVVAVIVIVIALRLYRGRFIGSSRRGTFDTIERPDRMDPSARILDTPLPLEPKAAALISPPRMKFYVSLRAPYELTQLTPL